MTFTDSISPWGFLLTDKILQVYLGFFKRRGLQDPLDTLFERCCFQMNQGMANWHYIATKCLLKTGERWAPSIFWMKRQPKQLMDVWVMLSSVLKTWRASLKSQGNIPPFSPAINMTIYSKELAVIIFHPNTEPRPDALKKRNVASI